MESRTSADGIWTARFVRSRGACDLSRSPWQVWEAPFGAGPGSVLDLASGSPALLPV